MNPKAVLRATALAALLTWAFALAAVAHNSVTCAGPAIGGGGFLRSVQQTSYLPYHGHYTHVFKVGNYTYYVVHKC